jgi:hypothetical protein
VTELSIASFEHAVRRKKPHDADQSFRVSVDRYRQLGGRARPIGDGKVGDDVQTPRKAVTSRHLL